MNADVASLDDSLDGLIAATAEPKAALERMDQYRSTHANIPEHLALLEHGLADPAWRTRLVAAFGNSPYLTRTITRWPEFLAICLDQGAAPRYEQRRAELLEHILAVHTEAEAASIMRRFKHREFLRIGLLDLTNEAPLEETTAGLSFVAECCLEAGYRWLDRHLSARFGPPMVQDGPERRLARFVILGMGKLGARELNFSSDIDLIYLYDQDIGETAGPNPIAIKSYFTRLGRDLMRLMQEKTSDGMVFRTDLRLRPEGDSGDLSLSCRSAEIYYESWGRTWERAAMIKARPVAGDIPLGNAFLERLRPFVYRRYLDFASLDAIREMKRKIDIKTAQAEHYQRNIKLGFGGIREIEFFVQCQQLIHGGKVPELRKRGTVEVLGILRERGLLTAATCDTLINAYRFLRMVEHRLQIEQEQQTHSLPESDEAMERLARRANRPDATTLRHHLSTVRESVHTIYNGLFYSYKESGPIDPMVETLITCDPDHEQCLSMVEQAGFQNPEQARSLLWVLRSGPRGVALRESSQLWYDRFAPLLLQEIVRAPDHDMALKNAEIFLQNIGYRVSYLAMLIENPPLLSLLVRLFGTSAYLSKFFNNHPELLDHLINRDFLDQYRNRSALMHDLTIALEPMNDTEERMNALRLFKSTEVLRIGVRDISGEAEPSEVMAGLSALADVLLTQVMADAQIELKTRHGSPGFVGTNGAPHRAQFAIVALGKLGGGELSYASDLDLIFIHGSQGDETWTSGPNVISNNQFFAKLGQKIINNITTITKSGKLYDLDMRLRPTGNSGPLVTSFESFCDYQRHEAWTWEHQALTRARVVVGDQELVLAIKQEIQSVLTMRRDREKLRRDVAEMRLRMYQEKKPPPGVVDLKQGRGGVVDIEFLVQYLMLAHAADHPNCLRREPTAALQALRVIGAIRKEEQQTVDDAYRLYRLIETRLRLSLDRSENRLNNDPVLVNRLERMCNLPKDESIHQLVNRHFSAVFAIYQKYLDTVSDSS